MYFCNFQMNAGGWCKCCSSFPNTRSRRKQSITYVYRSNDSRRHSRSSIRPISAAEQDKADIRLTKIMIREEDPGSILIITQCYRRESCEKNIKSEYKEQVKYYRPFKKHDVTRLGMGTEVGQKPD